MDQQEIRKIFISYLLNNDIRYLEDGERIIIVEERSFYINLPEIPDNISFESGEAIDIEGLKEINCENITFLNNGYVCLPQLENIKGEVIFGNKGSVHAKNLRYIPKTVSFENDGHIFIKGPYNLNSVNHVMDSKVMNAMLKRGIFER